MKIADVLAPAIKLAEEGCVLISWSPSSLCSRRMFILVIRQVLLISIPTVAAG